MYFSCKTSEIGIRRDPLWTGVVINRDSKVGIWKEIASLILLDPDTWKDTLLFANLGTTKFPTVDLLKRKVAFFEDPKIIGFTVKNFQILVPRKVYCLNGVEYKVYSGEDIIKNYRYG